jgi:transcriptional regulator with XRE-family HTH domain
MPNSAAEVALQRLKARLDVVEARDVAMRSKINEVTISRWKSGQQAFNPKLHTLERLAHGLGITVADLVCDEPRPPAASPSERNAVALEGWDAVVEIVSRATSKDGRR